MITEPFVEFPKIARLARECTITEKLDGTNGLIYITDAGEMLVGSRSRWITPEDDNYGFAAWAYARREELLTLGSGRHFGEWWGQGIQRKYGLSEKRFSLFNVVRWCLAGTIPQRIPTGDPRIEKYQQVLPPCCGLVPLLYRGEFSTVSCDYYVDKLRREGSVAAPGFMKPEGIVCYHIAAGMSFKKMLDKDNVPKGQG